MEFHIDMEALFEDLKNRAMLTIIAAAVPDDPIRTQMLGVMDVFIRHGISVDEGLKIITEIGEILNPKTEEKEND